MPDVLPDVRSRRSFSTSPSPRPSDGDLTAAVDDAHLVVDVALQLLLLLSPDATKWDVPAGAVDRALWSDERFERARARVREVEDRLRATVPSKFYPDLDDLSDAVHRAMSDAAECGWRLGFAMARRPEVVS